MSQSQRLLWRVGTTTTLLVVASSMCAPVLAVSLQKRGFSASAIGAFAMISFSTIAVLIPVMPSLFARFGIVRLYRLGMALNLLGISTYAWTTDFTIWCLAAVVGGSGGACVWNASEALLARHAPPDRRGQVMGIYQTALGGALAAGPLVPAVFRLEPRQALLLAATTMLAAFTLAMTRLAAARVAVRPTVEPRADGQAAFSTAPTAAPSRSADMTTWTAIRQVPGLCLVAFAGGVFEAGLNAISAAHGSQIGLSLAASASIVGAIGIGSFAAQYPAGIMADQAGPVRVFRYASVLLFASSALLIASAAWPWLLWAAALIWGGVGGALYTLSMIAVAHRFSGDHTAAGTAAMITGYTLGGALGPSISGMALDTAGTAGMGAWLALMAIAVGLVASRMR